MNIISEMNCSWALNVSLLCKTIRNQIKKIRDLFCFKKLPKKKTRLFLFPLSTKRAFEEVLTKVAIFVRVAISWAKKSRKVLSSFLPPKVSEPFKLMMPCKGREPRVVKKFFGH